MIALLCAAALAAPGAGAVELQGTLSPGWSMQTAELALYLHGDLEVRTGERHGLRGDASWFLGAQDGVTQLDAHHTVFVGQALHPAPGTIDPYVVLQPGLSWVERGEQRAIAPVVSAVAGVALRPYDLVSLFAEARVVGGRALGTSLAEVRAAGGLRFRPR